MSKCAMLSQKLKLIEFFRQKHFGVREAGGAEVQSEAEVTPEKGRFS